MIPSLQLRSLDHTFEQVITQNNIDAIKDYDKSNSVIDLDEEKSAKYFKILLYS
jgi:hypothetical protein